MGPTPKEEGPESVDTPPAGVSPAAARFLLTGRLDDLVFRTAMASAVDQDALRIEERSGTPTAILGEKKAQAADERALVRTLIAGQDSVPLKEAAALTPALSIHARWIDSSWGAKGASRPWAATAMGAALSGGTVAAMRLAERFPAVTISDAPLAMAYGGLALLGGAMVAVVWLWTFILWRRASVRPEGQDRRLGPLLGSAGLAFVSFGLVTMFSRGLCAAVGDVSPLVPGIGLLYLGIIATFWLLRRVPDKEGAQHRAELSAFRERLGRDPGLRARYPRYAQAFEVDTEVEP